MEQAGRLEASSEAQRHNIGVEEDDPTPQEKAEEFDDTDTADAAAVEDEKADPDDKRNSP